MRNRNACVVIEMPLNYDPHRPSRHHRLPTSIGGTSDAENISVVAQVEHNAWHVLFRNYSAEQIAEIINSTWLDPRYEFIVRRRR